MENKPYGIKKNVPLSYNEAIEKITETLKGEGFGILTEIDVKATLKKKIDQEFTPYVILGACNPTLAYEALSEELDVGLLLPCNVVVYQEPQSNETVINVIDPVSMVQITGRSDLDSFAQKVKEKLVRALDQV